MKNDIAALTDQITDALNSFAGTAGKQARRGYKQARANAEQAVDDMSERGSAMMDAAQDAASSIGETLEDAITRASAGNRGHRARPRLPDRRDMAQVILAQVVLAQIVAAPMTFDGASARLTPRRRCAWPPGSLTSFSDLGFRIEAWTCFSD